jgi:Flp pilus assembly pilin Flp
MELLKRLVVEEDGQGLVEYTLIVLLVALVFWVAVKGTNVDQDLTAAWGQISGCLTSPMSCGGS